MKLSTLIRSILAVTVTAAVNISLLSPAVAGSHQVAPRAALPSGAIEHILVIELENESETTTFGPSSPAVYLNTTLLSQGELIANYFSTSHVSLGNYIAQVSGQGPTPSTNSDCINLSSLTAPQLLGSFNNVSPGTTAANQQQNPGQVVGNGCVYPATVLTIGDQLDALYPNTLNWREYAEDMGNDIGRDYGVADPLGGADCAHPPVGGNDYSNSAAADDQYATRHNPFVYFHSVIDNQAGCENHEVPLGKVTVGANGQADSFSGHLYNDLSTIETTPKFMFVTPNLCNDGHDATCAGPNTEGTTNAAGQNIGGLAAADLWLKHWMPMILNSPAYQSGKMLVVITVDEGSDSDTRACANANQASCNAPSGPNLSNFGYSPVLGLYGLQTAPTTTNVYPGGGQVGAVVFNKNYIQPGSVNTTGDYNHFSALRSYEDLLGITTGGNDGLGHLGYAGTINQTPFGSDVFNKQLQD